MKNLKLQFKIQNFYLFTCSFAFLLLTFNFSPALAQDESSPSGTDAVRDKVRKTIENLVRKPKAVIGTLDSVTDSTLKIKTEDAKFVLVATTKDTEYAKTTKGKQVDVKFADLAIGDFIAALGYKNGNDILDAQRVLAFDTTPYLPKEIAFGRVEKNTKGTLKIKHPKSGEVWTIETTKTTAVTQRSSGKSKMVETTVSSIEEQDKVIVAGELNSKKDKALVASKIHVISAKAKISPSPSPKTSPKQSPKPSPTPNL